jgi:hypothetical protein
MPGKNITIDLDAYKRLTQNKLPNESYSQAIKRLFKLPTIKRTPKPPIDLNAWFKKFALHPMSEKAAKAIERCVAGRLNRSRRSV